MDVKIKVDFRERPSGIMEILRKMDGVRLEEKKLSVGDYQINDHIFVERKTTKDFIVSLIDGRLFSQASRLKRFTKDRLLSSRAQTCFTQAMLLILRLLEGQLSLYPQYGISRLSCQRI